MHKSRSCWVAALFPLLLAGAASAQDTPHDWLQRLSGSFEQLTYRGVFTYERGQHTESLRITHGQIDGEEYERLEHLDGERREIIRRGQHLTCIHPGDQLIRLYQKRVALRSGWSELERYYRLNLGAEERVAERRGVVVEIEPRDRFRYGYRLTLDHETGLLLSSELAGEDGQILERFKFATIDIGMPLQPEWVVATQQNQPAGNGSRTSTQEQDPQWRPAWLPPGFTLAMPLDTAKEPVQTYSDGLAVLSVFLEQLQGEQAPQSDGMAQRGATVAYTHYTERHDQPYMVTVVGEVPRRTARRVAHSVSWQAGKQESAAP